MFRIPLFIFLSTMLFSKALFSQGVSITGRIVDSETLEPLPYAHVYIDQTTIGTTSDINGEYIFEHINDGDYKLVFSYVGYELFNKTIKVIGRDVRLSVRLMPQKELLQAVEVKGSKDKEWENQLKQFHRVFFGEKEFANDCKILNPWVLDFTYSKSDKKFKATAIEPLQIENRALGYTVFCTLQDFAFDKKGYVIRGLYKFEEINTKDPKEAQKWTRNRRSAYQGSMRFLFKSIIDKHESQNGFEIFLDQRPNNSELIPASFSQDLNKSVFKLNFEDRITPAGRPGFYKITLDERIEIHHTTQFAGTKTYRDVAFPVSWIDFKKGYIEVSQDGYIVNNQDLTTSGELNKNRIASMLPTNYSPGQIVVVNYLTKRAIAKRLQERAHIQTDKCFYYPGETIWFKAFMNYANQSLRDSLSTVLYVEFIDPSATKRMTKILKLNDNMANANIAVPLEWSPGKYHIRAYTSWMKNYGPDIISYVPFIIMDKSMRLKASVDIIPKGDFDIVLPKQTFQASEQIDLAVLLDSSNMNFACKGSISVALASHSILPWASDIKETLFFKEDMPDGTLGDFIYPLEYSFSIHGRLFRPKKRATSGTLSVISGMMDSLFSIKTDSKGLFTIDYLSFEDTMRFSFQARNKRGVIFGQTEILPRESPPVLLPKSKIKLDTIHLSMPVEYFVNKPVHVESKNMEANRTEPEIGFNVGFDLVLTANDLKGIGSQSIVNVIQGRMPGLQVNSTTGKLSFRSGGLSSDHEPLILIDGIPMNTPTPTQNDPSKQAQVQITRPSEGSATSQDAKNSNNTTTISSSSQANIGSQENSYASTSSISHITVDNVSRVEVNSKMTPRYGASGAYGVIAIYTKKAQGKTNEIKTFDVFVVEGYSVPDPFPAPDSTANKFTGDYYPTILWLPSLEFSAKVPTKVSFAAPTKPGQYAIKIAAISEEGKPLSGTVLFNVAEKVN
jgi:CarboxypepD_reg-like domain/TonB-dependent Receptor Plug Domain